MRNATDRSGNGFDAGAGLEGPHGIKDAAALSKESEPQNTDPISPSLGEELTGLVSGLANEDEARNWARNVFDAKMEHDYLIAKGQMPHVEIEIECKHKELTRAMERLAEVPHLIEVVALDGPARWPRFDVGMITCLVVVVPITLAFGLIAMGTYVVNTGEFPALLNDGWSRYIFASLPLLGPIAAHVTFENLRSDGSRRRFIKGLAWTTAVGIFVWLVALATLGSASGGDVSAYLFDGSTSPGGPTFRGIALFVLPCAQFTAELAAAALVWSGVLSLRRQHQRFDYPHNPEAVQASANFEDLSEAFARSLKTQGEYKKTIATYESRREAYALSVVALYRRHQLARSAIRAKADAEPTSLIPH